MQDYFQQNLFANTADVVLRLSFVGSIATICTNLMSPVAQILISMYGIRAVLILGSFLVVLGFEMAGFSTQLWHLYLTHGIVFGSGASLIYVAVMGAAPQWFTKRRGLALGLIASGSGIGGLVIPFLMTGINSTLGYAWTYRILGFVCLFCNGIACLTVKERQVPAQRQRKKWHQIIDFSVFKHANFVLFGLASNIGLIGYFIPYYFLPSYGTYLGLTDSQGSALVSVISACNFAGRILTGYLADRIGKINTNTIMTIITAISCFLIWTFVHTYGGLMGFAVVFGLAGGSYFALLSPITVSLLGMEKFSSGLTALILANLIPVFGPNVASAIEAGVNSPPFFSYKMFAGVSYAIAALLLILLKFRLDRNICAKV